MSFVFDGKKEAELIQRSLGEKLAGVEKRIVLEIVLVGSDPINESYLEQLNKCASRLTAKDFRVELVVKSFDNQANFNNLSLFLKKESQKKDIGGILVQISPGAVLFEREKREAVVNLVCFDKDIDYLGKGFFKGPKHIPSVCQAVLVAIEKAGRVLSFNPSWVEVLVVGGERGFWGKRIRQTLINQGFEKVRAAGSGDCLSKLVPKVEVVISCVGKPGLIRAEMVKKGATVIDVGFVLDKGKITGDVDFEPVKKKAGFITPVPGGIGPLSTILVFKNLVERLGCLNS